MNHDGSKALNNANVAPEVGPYDVLCGRSAVALNNTGNRRFRVTVSMALQRYLSTPTRTGKTKVIDSIVASVKSSGGKFLKWRNSQWIELDGKQAREKVGHALRDMSSACEPFSAGQPTTALHNLSTRSAAPQSISRDVAGTIQERIPQGLSSESRQRKNYRDADMRHDERSKSAVASSFSLSSCSSSSSSSSTTSSSSSEALDYGMFPLEGDDGRHHDRFGGDHEFEFDFDLEPISSLENSAPAIHGEDIMCLLALLEKSELY